MSYLWLGEEDVQHGWHKMHRGDLLLLNELHQVGAVQMSTRFGHDQVGASNQRPEKFPDGHIEAERRFLQNAVAGIELVCVLHPQQAVDDAAMAVHGPFGLAGGAGGVDDVGEGGSGDWGTSGDWWLGSGRIWANRRVE